MKALVGAFNQEKALVGAFSVIVKADCETDGALLQGGAGHGPRGGGQVRGAADPGVRVREQVSHAGPRGPLRTEEYCYTR